MNKLNQLPSELLSLILTYVSNEDLPSCALINKSFYREAMSLLWHTIDIYSRKEYTAFTTCLIQSPNAAGHHVRSLYFTNCWGLLTDASLLEIIQYVPNLESLGTGLGQDIGDASLQHVPRYCPHLTSLNIWCGRSPDPDDYRITHATISALGHYCKQLTTLDLFQCAYLDYDRLWGVLEDAPLTTIRLILPYEVDTQVALRFAETAPLALQRYQQLTTLSIGSRQDNTGFITTINTHGLTWPHLTDFTLDRCYSLTDAMALRFAQAHPTLECLSLDFAELTDAFLDGLMDTLPTMSMLSVQNIPAISAAAICRLITHFGGLDEGVYCDGCDIYPGDEPNDKSYGYRLLCDDDDHPPVEWFDGSFYSRDAEHMQDDL